MSKSKNTEDSWKSYFSLTPYKRVVELAKTPDRSEFVKNSLLVTATVMAAGATGYLIFTVMGFIPM